MKEVSCKAFTVLLRDLKKNNIPADILCRDVPVEPDFIRNEEENLDWDIYCRMMANSRAVWNDDDYLRLGIQAVKWRVIPVLSAMVGFFLSPKEMYRLVTSPKKGIGTQYFRCITASFKETDDNRIEIRLELPEGYPYCREFFLITKGFFVAAPLLLKYPQAGVLMQETDRGALYVISLPHRRTMSAGIRQFLSLPSSKRAGVRELSKAYELLYERFNQLEESKARQQIQDKQLQTAYSISQQIRSDLDLDSTVRAVAESLINEAGFSAVEISIHTNMDRELIERNIRMGDSNDKMTHLTRKLVGHGNQIGEITFWLQPGSSVEHAQQLLDYIIPTISMEMRSALSFKLVNDYRLKLESKVDEIQQAIIAERRRISSEIHDDLGTNLSAIALMSGVINENAKIENAEKISVAARQSLEKISEIVWSLNPRNDRLVNLVAYVRKYAMEYFDMTPIQCRVNIPEPFPDTAMTGERRRNIFLSVKEALHNVLKHSGATSVDLSFSTDGKHGEIVIHDNGKGIAEERLNQFGNGLQNMKQRMESSGGYLTIGYQDGAVIRLGYGLT